MKDFPLLTTRTLDPKENSLLAELINSSSVVVSDVDYTFVHFAQGHQMGIKTLASLFGEDIACEVDRLFQLKLEGQRRLKDQAWDQRKEFDLVIKMTQDLQQSCGKNGWFKVFSRETDLIIAANKFDRILKKEEIEKGRDVYWDAVGRYSSVYPDAGEFINYVGQMKRPLILMSGSDGVMQVTTYGTLIYDPHFSACRKQQRFQHLPFSYAKAVFGDPVDKPDPRFFDKVFTAVQDSVGHQPKAAEMLFVGDSLGNDLKVPYEQGALTVLIKRSA